MSESNDAPGNDAPTDDNDAALTQEHGAAEESVDHAAEAEKWQALARKHEKALRASQQEHAATQQENESLRLQLMQRDVAEAAGLPRAFADRLRGSTPEELAADAETMVKMINQGKPPALPRIPGIGPHDQPGVDVSGDVAGDYMRAMIGRR